jgi:hypothetical protein
MALFTAAISLAKPLANLESSLRFEDLNLSMS